MDKIEAIEHNKRVIRNVVTALIENKLVDPFRLLTEKAYATEQIITYLQAANIARGMMNMPELYLIDINEVD
jgi:hypothetical protein